MIVLGKRLMAVREMLEPGGTVADIGTDHAHLLICLLQEEPAARGIGVEKNPGPCRAARAAVAAHGLGGRIEIRQGDGLAPLAPGEVDQIVIAGLGGPAMAGILGARPDVLDGCRNLVLQPQNDPGRVRHFLFGRGWRIARETLVRERGRLYPVICARPGTGPDPSWQNTHIGPDLLDKRPKYLVEYIEGMIGERQRILAGLARSSRPAGDRRRILEEEIRLLKGVLDDTDRR